MKLISWNVNGFRAVLKKGFNEFVVEQQPDILCLQEVKAHRSQVEIPGVLTDYLAFWNSAEKAGYSGVAIFTREKPLEVKHGIGISTHDTEGRVLTLEYPDFYLVNVYTPNAQDGLRRIDYRLKWDAAFRVFVEGLSAQKPVVFCGDLNVARHEIDLARPRENRQNPGFSDEERHSFENLMNAGFTDTFRHFHPDKTGAYTWWSYRAGARERNVGWRIDYFGVSNAFTSRTTAAGILPEVTGSDHCPVWLTLG